MISPDIVERIPENILAIAFLVIFILTFLLSIGFIYHWKKYSMSTSVAGVATAFYIAITALLLAASLGLLSIVIW